jgi:hypothetical protein
VCAGGRWPIDDCRKLLLIYNDPISPVVDKVKLRRVTLSCHRLLLSTTAEISAVRLIKL